MRFVLSCRTEKIFKSLLLFKICDYTLWCMFVTVTCLLLC